VLACHITNNDADSRLPDSTDDVFNRLQDRCKSHEIGAFVLAEILICGVMTERTAKVSVPVKRWQKIAAWGVFSASFPPHPNAYGDDGPYRMLASRGERPSRTADPPGNTVQVR